jgi:hypothetical protein
VSIAFSQGHAVVIGVGGDLPNTVDDAVGVANILRDPSRCAYPQGQVELLTSARATRENTLAALDALATVTNDRSTVLVYYSGHGERISSRTGEFYYLLTQGYDLNKLDRTAVAGAEFADRLRAIRAQKTLVLLDCCHSGGLEAVKGPDLKLKPSAMPPEALTLLTRGSGRALIASSREHESSFAGKPYSAFTLALIEALCGLGAAKRDGYVRVSDLALYTHRMVADRTRDRQHPIFEYRDADNFILAYYAGGEAAPKRPPIDGQPEIEPEPGAFRAIDQRGQVVHGPQTNVAGDSRGPVLSGTFHGPVKIGGRD